MNRNVTLVLMAVFAALLVYALWDKFPWAPPPATPTPAPTFESKAIWNTTADQIVLIRVTDLVTNNQVVINRQSPLENWTITVPNVVADADQMLSGSLANQAAGLTYVEKLQAADNLQVFGLDAPKYSIEIETLEGNLKKLLIGDKTPTGSAYYVLLSGEPLPMVMYEAGLNPLFQILTKPPILPTPTPAFTLPMSPTLNLSGTVSP